MLDLFLSTSLYIGARDYDKRVQEAIDESKETGVPIEQTRKGQDLVKSGTEESFLKKRYKQEAAPPKDYGPQESIYMQSERYKRPSQPVVKVNPQKYTSEGKTYQYVTETKEGKTQIVGKVYPKYKKGLYGIERIKQGPFKGQYFQSSESPEKEAHEIYEERKNIRGIAESKAPQSEKVKQLVSALETSRLKGTYLKGVRQQAVDVSPGADISKKSYMLSKPKEEKAPEGIFHKEAPSGYEKRVTQQISREQKISENMQDFYTRFGIQRDETVSAWRPKEIGKSLARFIPGAGAGGIILGGRIALFSEAMFHKEGRRAAAENIKNVPQGVKQMYNLKTPEGWINLGLTFFTFRGLVKYRQNVMIQKSRLQGMKSETIQAKQGKITYELQKGKGTLKTGGGKEYKIETQTVTKGVAKGENILTKQVTRTKVDGKISYSKSVGIDKPSGEGFRLVKTAGSKGKIKSDVYVYKPGKNQGVSIGVKASVKGDVLTPTDVGATVSQVVGKNLNLVKYKSVSIYGGGKQLISELQQRPIVLSTSREVVPYTAFKGGGVGTQQTTTSIQPLTKTQGATILEQAKAVLTQPTTGKEAISFTITAPDIRQTTKVEQKQTLKPIQEQKEILIFKQEIEPISKQAFDFRQAQESREQQLVFQGQTSKPLVETISKQEAAQQEQSKQEAIQKPVFQQKRGPIQAVDLPKPSPLVITSFKSPEKPSPLSKQYRVSVRRGGIFKQIGTTEDLKEAFRLGKQRVSTTAAASFKIEGGSISEIMAKSRTQLPQSQFRMSKVNRIVFVEKREKRIKSPGELSEITFKGLRTLKARKFKL